MEELGIAERPAGEVGFIFLGLGEPLGEDAFGGVVGKALLRGYFDPSLRGSVKAQR
jgi:hypothetical protein